MMLQTEPKPFCDRSIALRNGLHGSNSLHQVKVETTGHVT
jgi:hypothetical protein